MKKLFFIVLLFLLISSTSTGHADNHYGPGAPKYNLETIELATKISKLKGKYYLEYKDQADLLDTCSKIVKYCAFDPRFNKYDIAAIVLKESKFNHKAFNRQEKVKGLMQITKPRIYHKEELFWYNNPESKDQNIIAGLIILNARYDQYKTKKLAIMHYNGSNEKARAYSNSVMALKKEIKATKV